MRAYVGQEKPLIARKRRYRLVFSLFPTCNEKGYEIASRAFNFIALMMF